ncbi:unnamed protein product [Laminaria digitata]
MPSPPVLRLSQALYTNVPSPARAPPAARSSSRKREHGQVAASACEQKETATPSSSASVRLLLPRAFDVADRAYHARQQFSEAAAAAVVSEEVGHVEVGVVACLCCGDGSEIEKRQLPVAATAGIIAGDNTARDCCGCEYQQQQRFDPLAAAAAAAVAVAARGGGAEMVVVESVLGFSALHSLLERSLATAAPQQQSRDHHDLNGPSGGGAAGAAADGSDAEALDGTRRGERSDPAGVSEAVGRLVGWLRTVSLASTALLEGHEGNDDIISYRQHQITNSSSSSSNNGSSNGSKKSSSSDNTSDNLREAGLVGEPGNVVGNGAYDADGRRTFPATGKRKTSPHEAAAEAPAAAAVAATTAICGASTDDLRCYQVTGRCEVGSEWSAFTLKPAAMQTQALKGQFGDGGGGGGGECSTERTLEIRLICHPLVTMVPDIRWCLRLIGQAKATASLMNANAKLSTLGGGYFLTRQVGQAISLARTQSEVAMALGDLQLAGKCRINEAYNYIWMGRYIEARCIIRTQVLASRAVHDEELENVATIASRFLRRSKKANRRLMETQFAVGGGGGSGSDGGVGVGGGDGGGGGGDNCQKWMRQKIDVKTDEWHRVRALPMYCSSGGGNSGSSSGRAAPAGWGDGASRVRQELT